MTTRENLNRLYAAWKEKPCDETFEPLYKAARAKARIIVASLTGTRDEELEHDLATDCLMECVEQPVPAQYSFATWLSLRFWCACTDTLRQRQLEQARFCSLDEAKDSCDTSVSIREQLIALLPKLRRREKRIVALLANGYTQEEIGRRLGLSQRHIGRLLKKTSRKMSKTPISFRYIYRSPKQS